MSLLPRERSGQDSNGTASAVYHLFSFAAWLDYLGQIDDRKRDGALARKAS